MQFFDALSVNILMTGSIHTEASRIPGCRFMLFSFASLSWLAASIVDSAKSLLIPQKQS